MQTSAFERYQTGDSLIHRLDPRVKVIVTVLFVLSNLLIPDGAWVGFVLALAMVLIITHWAGLPWNFALKRSLIVLPFTLAAVTIVFATPGAALASIHIGPWTLTPTDAGLIRFASIILRSLLSVQMAILLTATTPFPDLIHALRHLRLPQPLVATLSFMYRYLFVLSEETTRLLRARRARSAQQPGLRSGGPLLWRARVAGNMVGQLFLRSLERGDRVYQAMLARGYTGHLYTLNPHVMQRHDWLMAALALVALAAIQILSRL
jgi:cobalt/nickel transport system permease protein